MGMATLHRTLIGAHGIAVYTLHRLFLVIDLREVLRVVQCVIQGGIHVGGGGIARTRGMRDTRKDPASTA